MADTRMAARQRPAKRWWTRPQRLDYISNPESGVPWGQVGWPDLSTGATAGIPGELIPEGAYKPYELNDMGNTTADPATAWTTGQYVVLGDGSHAYWDGDSWEAGEAP